MKVMTNIKQSFSNLTLSLHVIHCAGHNTDLPSKVRVSIAFTRTFFKEYLVSFLMIFKLIGALHLRFSSYWCLKLWNYWNLKNRLFQFFRDWKDKGLNWQHINKIYLIFRVSIIKLYKSFILSQELILISKTVFDITS